MRSSLASLAMCHAQTVWFSCVFGSSIWSCCAHSNCIPHLQVTNTSDEKHFQGGLLQFCLNSFGLFVASHCETSVLGKLVRSKFYRIFSTAMPLAGHYGSAAAPQAALLYVPNCITVPYWIVQPLQSAPSQGLISATTPHVLLTIIAGGGTGVIVHLPGANSGMSACFVTWPRTAYSSNGLHLRRRVTRASVRPIYWLGAAGNL